MNTLLSVATADVRVESPIISAVTAVLTEVMDEAVTRSETFQTETLGTNPVVEGSVLPAERDIGAISLSDEQPDSSVAVSANML